MVSTMLRPYRLLHCMLGRGLGGIERAFATYSEGLSAQGHTLIHCISDGAAIEAALPKDSVICSLPTHSQFDPRLIKAANTLIRQHAPDVIVAHGKRADRVFTYAQWLYRKTTPHIEVLHRPRYHRLQRADGTITVSRDLQQGFIARHGEGVSVEAYPNMLAALPSHAELAALSAPPVIGFLGRFVPEKGLDILLDAAALVHARGQPFKLRIGGDGPLKPALMAQAERLGIASSVQWLGWVEDSNAFYQGIDILCVPSKRESFGLIVIEAFAHARAVLATRTSGPQSIIEDGVNGVLCGIDPHSMADALSKLLTSPARVTSLARTGHKAAGHYTTAAVMPHICDYMTRTITLSKYASQSPLQIDEQTHGGVQDMFDIHKRHRPAGR
jgi:glycosyltransferase involved in cell wall biosynthesis